MKRNLISSIFIALCLMVSTGLNAETIFKPRVLLGFSSYDLGFTSGASFSSTSYIKGGIGATIASGQTYFDFSYNGSLAAAYDEGLIPDQEFIRTDITLTVGYAMRTGYTLFGGFKSGTTEYTDLFVTNTTTEFAADGIYGGLGYSFRSGKGVWSFNAALAFLNGTLTDDDPITANQFNAEADSVGFGLGAGYVLPLDNDQTLAFKANYQIYDYKDWVDANGNNVSDIQEEILSIDAEYSVAF